MTRQLPSSHQRPVQTTHLRLRAIVESPAAALRLACLLAVFCFATLSRAQPPAPPPQPPASADPPGRVGRLTGIEGAVSFRAAADSEWGYAAPNQPATTGDRIWSDSNGRAEIEVGDAAVRIWHQTEVDVVRLDDHTVQLAIPQGSAAL